VAAKSGEFQLFEQQRQRCFHPLRAVHRGEGGYKRPAGVGQSRDQAGRCCAAAPGSAVPGLERQGLALLGLLQNGEHELKGGHPYGHVQLLDHQSGCRIPVATGKQVLPQVLPGLTREELTLAAALEQGAWLDAQAIHQVVHFVAPGPRAMDDAAIDSGQLADPAAVQIDNQSVMVQTHRDLKANQCGRLRVDPLAHLYCAGAPHPHRQLRVGNAGKVDVTPFVGPVLMRVGGCVHAAAPC